MIFLSFLIGICVGSAAMMLLVAAQSRKSDNYASQLWR